MLHRLTILLLTLTVTLSSCSKESNTGGVKFKEDPNNFFTATFNGKTIKTTGFIFTINGVTDDASGSIAAMNANLLTSNVAGTVKTSGTLSVSGSTLNLGAVDQYKIPVQQLDASLRIERSGNTVGTYKITDFGLSGFYTSSITDLTSGKKQYDLDPASTSVNITIADALFIQGTYTGMLIDGSRRIPVTGSFKLRKL
jgi:hypothetical protein